MIRLQGIKEDAQNYKNTLRLLADFFEVYFIVYILH